MPFNDQSTELTFSPYLTEGPLALVAFSSAVLLTSANVTSSGRRERSVFVDSCSHLLKYEL